MKVTVIAGPAKCGKTLLANMLASGQKSEYVKVPSEYTRRFAQRYPFGNSVDPETTLLIIDDLPLDLLEEAISICLINERIPMDKQNEPTYYVSPDILITVAVEAHQDLLFLAQKGYERLCNLIYFQKSERADFPLPLKHIEFKTTERNATDI